LTLAAIQTKIYNSTLCH